MLKSQHLTIFNAVTFSMIIALLLSLDFQTAELECNNTRFARGAKGWSLTDLHGSECSSAFGKVSKKA